MAKDEDYEKGVVKGNMVYKIHWTEPPTLMPVESMSGHIPQVSIFDTKEVKRKIFTELRSPPFSLIHNVGKQNTRGNVSKISVSLACCRQIGSKSTNHSPLA